MTTTERDIIVGEEDEDDDEADCHRFMSGEIEHD